jgi:hypothetical protein
MSVDALIVASAGGAALLVLWILVRFPDAGPSDFKHALVHLAIATAVAFLLVPTAVAAIASVSLMLGYLAVNLPVLVYLVLASAWTLRALQRSYASGYQ